MLTRSQPACAATSFDLPTFEAPGTEWAQIWAFVFISVTPVSGVVFGELIHEQRMDES